MLLVSCPQCKQRYGLPIESAGTTKTCRVCACKFEVPVAWELNEERVKLAVEPQQGDQEQARIIKDRRSAEKREARAQTIRERIREYRRRTHQVPAPKTLKALGIAGLIAIVGWAVFASLPSRAEKIRRRVARTLFPQGVPPAHVIQMESTDYWEGEVDDKTDFERRVSATGRYVNVYSQNRDRTKELPYKSGFDGVDFWSRSSNGRVHVRSYESHDFARMYDLVESGRWCLPDALELEFVPEQSTLDVVTLKLHLPETQMSGDLTIGRDNWLPRSFKMDSNDLELKFESYRSTLYGPVIQNCERYDEGNLDSCTLVTNVDFKPEFSDSTFDKPRDTSKPQFDEDPPIELETMRDKSGRLCVEAIINGQKIGWLIFDTGAYTSSVHEKVAKQLNLEYQSRSKSSGIGGTWVESKHYKIDSFQLGAFNPDVGSIKTREYLEIGRSPDIVGLLGCNVIRTAIFEYDNAAGTITIHNPKTYKLPQHGEWHRIIVDYSPIIHAEFAKIPGRYPLLMDTGAFSVYVGGHTSLGERLGGVEGDATVTRGLGGSSPTVLSKYDWIEFADRRFEDIKVRIGVNERERSFNEYECGLFGIDLMTEFTLVFDLANKRIGFVDRWGGKFDK